MSDTDGGNEAERAQGGAYPSELDNRRAPPHGGEPPRPSTEPKGTEGHSTPKAHEPSDLGTARESVTDANTGEPLKP